MGPSSSKSEASQNKQNEMKMGHQVQIVEISPAKPAPIVNELLNWDLDLSKLNIKLPDRYGDSEFEFGLDIFKKFFKKKYEFNGLKFKHGILSEVNHSWSVSLTRSSDCSWYNITTTLELPKDFDLVNDELQLWYRYKWVSAFDVEYTKQSCEMDPKYMRWTSSRMNTIFWPNAVQKIRFILEIKKDGIYTISQQKTSNESNDPNCFMTFQALLSSTNLSDFTLICEGTELPAHRLVLAWRSTVFKAMLYDHKDTKEAMEGRVEVEGVTLATLRRMLEFIYTGKVADLKDNAIELYIAADRFGITSDLEAICSQQLLTDMTHDNVLDIYSLADNFKIESLMLKAFEMMHHDRICVFKDVETYKSFSSAHPEVTYKILLTSIVSHRY